MDCTIREQDGHLVVRGGYLLNQQTQGSGSLESTSDAPAVHSKDDQERILGRGLRMVYDALFFVRYHDPVDPRLAALRGSFIILDGWAKFRREWVRDFQDAAKHSPDIVGRVPINAVEDLARLCWRRIKANIREWGLYHFSRAFTPRQVVGLYAKHYVPRHRPDLAKSRLKITMDGDHAGFNDPYFGSATTREGTLHELASDIANPVARETAHKRIDKCIAVAQANEAKKDGNRAA